MIYQQSEARLIRGCGLVLAASMSAYIAFCLYGFLLPAEAQGLYKPGLYASLALLAALLSGAFYATFMNPRISTFLIEVDEETKKIHWPVWDTVKSSTSQVIVVMVFLMVFLFLVDYALTQLRDVIY